ncbi:helix-turn-helix domain-containing protein [Alloprevotella sp. Lung230]|uniref:helix-turn-helix domain-containing protein n=1 Tax=Alloprevotella sp. Lung230 TaxID=2766595 RepID=UPI001655A7A3|nr:helix-turn-helix transcriptional regulator [Alloprevotella sp. Lung230]MBC8626411.1 helix-turn-helix transcriptional regulator [Alloprevotella sp. Lung230]
MLERLQQIRDYYNLPQQLFAQKLELSPSTISSIFTGRTKPGNNLVQAIHRAFPEINIVWLMFGEGEMMLEDTEKFSTNANTDIEQNQISPSFPNFVEGGNATSSPDTPSLFPDAAMGGRESLAGRGMAKSTALSSEMQLAMLSQLANAKQLDKPQRKIKEIRVFYDDGTFEAFAPLTK